MDHYMVHFPGCHVMDDFEVTAIPYLVYVDKEFKVQWCGHPNFRKDIVADVNALRDG